MTDMTLQEAMAEVKRLTAQWGPWHEGRFPPGMKAFAVVGNAAASGELTPATDAELAVALVVEQAAYIAKRCVYQYADPEPPIRALADTDALAQVRNLQTLLERALDANGKLREKMQALRDALAELEAERDELVNANDGLVWLTADKNNAERDAAEWQRHAEAAEAKLAALVEAGMEWADARYNVDTIAKWERLAAAESGLVAALASADALAQVQNMQTMLGRALEQNGELTAEVQAKEAQGRRK